MVVSFMGTQCVLWLIVRFMVAAVRFMVNCALYGYCAFYGSYNSYPTRYSDMIPRFGRPVPPYSIISTAILRWDNAFATFILFRRKISFSNPELFFHFARCTKDTLKCISMFFAFSNDIRKGGIFIDF